MPLIEKHGGLWLDEPNDVRTRPVYERFDQKAGLIAVVYRSPTGHLVAALYEKVEGAPQWRLPYWSERRPEAIFNDESEAISYVENLLRTQGSI
jgi:hypothetical protein